MRNFDLCDVILDNEGNPLYGKVFFTERGAGGSSLPALKNIYDANGTALANPIFTDAEGRITQQVFLADGDYSVWFYQYVGGGNMAEDSSEDSWLFVRSLICTNTYEEMELTLASSKYTAVENVEALRSLDPSLVSGTTKAVILKGYFTAGDKHIVAYHASTAGSEDGGSCIHSSADSTVYWIMEDYGPDVDIRDFGVFPDLGDDTDVGQLALASSYASSSGKTLYFPKGSYKLNGGNYTLNNILVDNGVNFVGKAGTTTTLTATNVGGYASTMRLFSSDTGKIVFNAKTAYTSWISGTCTINASEVLYVNSSVTITEDGCGKPKKVYILCAFNNDAYFKDCEIIRGNGTYNYLSNNRTYHFARTNFSDRLFYNNTLPTSYTLNGCSLDIDNFSSIPNYINARLVNGDTEIDLHGKYCSSFSYTAGAATDIRIINGRFGTLTLDKTASSSYTAYYSLFNCSVDDLKLTVNVDKIVLDNCDVTMDSSNPSLLAVRIFNGSVIGEISSKDIIARGAKIESPLTSIAVYEDDSITAEIDGCLFSDSGYLKLHLEGATSASYAIENNIFIGSASNGLQIVDGSCTIRNFVYYGNVGKVIQTSVRKASTSDFTVVPHELGYNLVKSTTQYSILCLGKTKVSVSVSISCGINYSTSCGKDTRSFNEIYDVTGKTTFQLPLDDDGYVKGNSSGQIRLGFGTDGVAIYSGNNVFSSVITLEAT